MSSSFSSSFSSSSSRGKSKPVSGSDKDKTKSKTSDKAKAAAKAPAKASTKAKSKSKNKSADKSASADSNNDDDDEDGNNVNFVFKSINNESCTKCGNTGDLILCDMCNQSFHGFCVEPPITPDDLRFYRDHEFMCPVCKVDESYRAPHRGGLASIDDLVAAMRDPRTLSRLGADRERGAGEDKDDKRSVSRPGSKRAVAVILGPGVSASTGIATFTLRRGVNPGTEMPLQEFNTANVTTADVEFCGGTVSDDESNDSTLRSDSTRSPEQIEARKFVNKARITDARNMLARPLDTDGVAKLNAGANASESDSDTEKGMSQGAESGANPISMWPAYAFFRSFANSIVRAGALSSGGVAGADAEPWETKITRMLSNKATSEDPAARAALQQQLQQLVRDLAALRRKNFVLPSFTHFFVSLLSNTKDSIITRVYTENMDDLEAEALVRQSMLVRCNGSLSTFRCSKSHRAYDGSVIDRGVFSGTGGVASRGSCVVQPDKEAVTKLLLGSDDAQNSGGDGKPLGCVTCAAVAAEARRARLEQKKARKRGSNSIFSAVLSTPSVKVTEQVYSGSRISDKYKDSILGGGAAAELNNRKRAHSSSSSHGTSAPADGEDGFVAEHGGLAQRSALAMSRISITLTQQGGGLEGPIVIDSSDDDSDDDEKGSSGKRPRLAAAMKNNNARGKQGGKSEIESESDVDCMIVTVKKPDRATLAESGYGSRFKSEQPNDANVDQSVSSGLIDTLAPSSSNSYFASSNNVSNNVASAAAAQSRVIKSNASGGPSGTRKSTRARDITIVSEMGENDDDADDDDDDDDSDDTAGVVCKCKGLMIPNLAPFPQSFRNNPMTGVDVIDNYEDRDAVKLVLIIGSSLEAFPTRALPHRLSRNARVVAINHKPVALPGYDVMPKSDFQKHLNFQLAMQQKQSGRDDRKSGPVVLYGAGGFDMQLIGDIDSIVLDLARRLNMARDVEVQRDLVATKRWHLLSVAARRALIVRQARFFKGTVKDYTVEQAEAVKTVDMYVYHIESHDKCNITCF